MLTSFFRWPLFRPCLPGLLAAIAELCPALAGDPAPAAGRPLQILVGGDVTLGYHLDEYFDELRARGDTSEAEMTRYPFRRIRSRTRAADLFWINLEGTLTAHGDAVEKNYNFRADPGAVNVLVDAGVDVACLANNHAFDFGVAGVVETRATLDAAGIGAYGAGRDLAEARRPLILSRHDRTFGFIGYVWLGALTSEPEEMFATATTAGVAGTRGQIDRLARWVDEDVRALARSVDTVLVSFHWGREATHLVLPGQRRLAQVAARAGAHLVVGHHPHALQGFERFGETFVAYSLGNLMFAGNWNPTFKDAALLEVLVPRTGRGLADTRFLPIGVDSLPGAPFQPWFRTGADADRVLADLDCFSHATTEDACAPATPTATGDD
ncbi:MAG: CapA family protein [Acidobacteriota bacterium]